MILRGRLFEEGRLIEGGLIETARCPLPVARCQRKKLTAAFLSSHDNCSPFLKACLTWSLRHWVMFILSQLPLVLQRRWINPEEEVVLTLTSTLYRSLLLQWIFNEYPKVIRNLHYYALWLVYKLFNQSDAKPKIKTNRYSVVTRVFPRLAPVMCTGFDFSLVHFAFHVCCDWPL